LAKEESIQRKLLITALTNVAIAFLLVSVLIFYGSSRLSSKYLVLLQKMNISNQDELRVFNHYLVENSKHVTSAAQVEKYIDEQNKLVQQLINKQNISNQLIAEESEVISKNTMFEITFILVLGLLATLDVIWGVSRGVTQRISQPLIDLAHYANEIAQGNFKHNIRIETNDEVGKLAQAFVTMIREIERLLIETKEKSRMEQELKTARLVQESLFPKRSTYSKNEIELTGSFISASECGGDWWFYFEQGDYLYIMIADATGHGTSAALMTSAVRSLFSQIKEMTMSLPEICKSWDRAIASCSNGKMFMTGLIVQIETKTGTIKCVNASHELPIVLRKQNNCYQFEDFFLESNSTFGELKSENWSTHELQLRPGDKMILLTDGFYAIKDPNGKTINEKRMIKIFESFASESKSSHDQCSKIFNYVDEFRENQAIPLVDDLTVVVIERGLSQY
jgi:sigma-B regulation protein RsbU (phosphoserine phosphatase)